MPKIGIAAPGQHSSMNLSSSTYYALRSGRQYAHVLTLWMRNDRRELESVRRCSFTDPQLSQRFQIFLTWTIIMTFTVIKSKIHSSLFAVYYLFLYKENLAIIKYMFLLKSNRMTIRINLTKHRSVTSGCIQPKIVIMLKKKNAT